MCRLMAKTSSESKSLIKVKKKTAKKTQTNKQAYPKIDT